MLTAERVRTQSRPNRVLRAAALIVASILPIVNLYKIQNDIRFFAGDDASQTMFEGFASGTDIGMYHVSNVILGLGTASLIAIMVTLSVHRDFKFITTLLIAITSWFGATFVLSLATLFPFSLSLISAGFTVLFFTTLKASSAGQP